MSIRPLFSRLALAAAALYAATGAIELGHDQPTVFAGAVDYWIEALFVGALAATAAVLFALGRAQAGRAGKIGGGVAAAGTMALLVAATATLAAGREQLDPLFGLGFLAIVAGYLMLAVADVRGRVAPERAGVVLLAGFVATVVADSATGGAGGLVLAATWAALARLLAPAATVAVSRAAAAAR